MSGDARLKPLYSWRRAIVESELAPPARLVLLCLSLYMNERTSSAFPSYDRLVSDTGLSRRAVIGHVKASCEAGWLVVQQGGGRRSNVYHAAIPTLSTPVQEVHPSDGEVQEVHRSGAPGDVGGVQEVHPNNPGTDPLNSDGGPRTHPPGSFFLPGSGWIEPSS